MWFPAGRSMAKNFWSYKWGTVPAFSEFCLFCKTVCHPVQRCNWCIIPFWAKSKASECLLVPASFAIGTGGYFPGLKQSSCKVYHSSPPSTSVKNEFSYNSTPPVCLQGVDWNELYLQTFGTTCIYFKCWCSCCCKNPCFVLWFPAYYG
jgi:hypothetical protein